MSPLSTPHPIVCFGEILWDILPDKSLPGGAPMNVAYHLKKLGLQPVPLSRVGADDYGKQLLQLLASNQLSTHYVQVDEEHDTGLVYAQLGFNHEVTYDIVYPSAWDFIEWQNEFERLQRDASYFVFGSLITRNATSRNTLYQLLEVAQTKVLDINLRTPYYSQSVIEELLRKANIVKLNEAELEKITAWYGVSNSKEEQMQLLQDRFHLPTVIITMGGNGAIVSDGGAFYYNPGYKVQVADTIGSGDAFLAGFLYQLYNKASIQEALDFASGLGALIATYHGAWPAYEPAQIKQLTMANLPSSI